MVAEQVEVQQVDKSLLGRLELGVDELPYVDLNDWPFISTKLELNSVVFTFDRSFPIKGYSAIMPEYISDLKAKSRKILVVERPERYYVYVA